MVAEDEEALLVERNFAYVFAVFLKNVNLMGLSFGFKERFEAGFVLGYAWVGLARKSFFEDYLPSFHVGSYIVECAAIDLNVHRRVRWTVKDSVESYISAQAMGKKQAADDAFVDNVKSASVVEAMEICVGLSYSREKDEFTWQISHAYSYVPVALKCFLAPKRFRGKLSPYGKEQTKDYPEPRLG